MIDINKRLTENQKDFFNKLSLYIDKPIYFYGSITRDDYIPGKSDIDVDIFTENESSTIHLLCNFLKIKKQDLRKSLYKINNNMVYGYKVKYNDEINNIDTEISVFNDKYKSSVVQDQAYGSDLPFYITFIIYIVKFLYYNLNIIPEKIYKNIKRLLMNGGETNFILVEN